MKTKDAKPCLSCARIVSGYIEDARHVDGCPNATEVCGNCDVEGLIPGGLTAADCVVCKGTRRVKLTPADESRS